MYRVLIVSESEQLVSTLQEQLHSDFYVEVCGSGKWALELVKDYSPDILVLDNVIADMGCLDVLQAIRASGKLIHVIIYSNFRSPYIEKQLECLGVDLLVMKPCKTQALAGHVKALACMLENSTISWNIEQVLDNLLLDLGFHVGANNFQLIRETILLRYMDGSQMMKEMYVDVAHKYGGNIRSVEKAVRDGIKAARSKGNPELWNLLFAYCIDGQNGPRNEEFVGRIVLFLRQQSRLKPAYKELPAQII